MKTITEIIKAQIPRPVRMNKTDRDAINSLLEQGLEEEAIQKIKTLYEESTTEYTKLVDEVFPSSRHPGKRPNFGSEIGQRASKFINSGQRERAIELLEAAYAENKGKPSNFGAPLDVNVLVYSKPPSEWGVSKTIKEVQRKVYSSPEGKVSEWSKAFNTPTKDGGGGAKFAESFFRETGINRRGMQVEDCNNMFKAVFKTYFGVEKKVQNRNAKKLERLKKRGREAEFSPETAYNEDGTLKQPPGPNVKIFTTSTCKAKTTLPDKIAELQKKQARGKEVPGLQILLDLEARITRQCRIDEPLSKFGHADRVAIIRGEPGYIPPHDREGLNPGKRIRRGSNRNRTPDHPKYVAPENRKHTPYPDHRPPKKRDPLEAALPLVVSYGDEFIVVDARGIVRQLYYRGLLPENYTMEDVVKLVTGNPVIDIGERWVRTEAGEKLVTKKPAVSYRIKDTKSGVTTAKVETKRSTASRLKQMCAEGPVGVLGVDLGQKNPVAAAHTKVSLEEELSMQCEHKEMLTEQELRELEAYRVAQDAFKEGAKAEALKSLSVEDQEVIEEWRSDLPEKVKSRLCSQLGLDEKSLPWDKMTGHSTYISDQLLAVGKAPPAGKSADTTWFSTPSEKNPKTAYRKYKGEKKPKKASDKAWFSEYSIKLDKEVRERWNAAEHDILRGNPYYKRFSKRAQQFCRTVVNRLVASTKQHTGCQDVVIVLEDLTLDNKFASGKGKRGVGWGSFSKPKRENRWLLQRFHAAFSEQATNHGIPVLLVDPSYTSKTCPECGHCSPQSRSLEDRDKFLCVGCGVSLHADLDVATINITKVAVQGYRLPGARGPAVGKTPAPLANHASPPN